VVKPASQRFAWARRVATGILVFYCTMLTCLVIMEPRLVYQPFDGPTEPVAAGAPSFTKKQLETQEIPTITYWENKGQNARFTLVYFHGNGGGLHAHAPALAALDTLGIHIVAMEYAGYPGAAGTPSEATLTAQSRALYDMVAARNDGPLVIWGYSLGSGVATQLAAARSPAALVLEAPFTAVIDRAAELFPLMPVRQLMRNTYLSRSFIGKVKAPVFIMHGDADMIVPIHHGRALFALANEPKTFMEYAGRGHLDLLETSAYRDALAFITRSLQK
jgi:fermentation-respiration switch protein FrsA (DUF1100 family)